MITRVALTVVMVTICMALLVATEQAQSQSTTFYVSSGTDPNGDLAWQSAVGSFTEFDMNSYFNGQVVRTITDGATVVTIGPGSTGQQIFFGGYGGAAGGVYGTVSGGALLARDGNGVNTDRMTFHSSQPVTGFGLWVFDDGSCCPDSFTMTVTEVGGGSFVSGILDANPGLGNHTVEGFLGATSTAGITSVEIADTRAGGGFEADHLQLGGSIFVPVVIDIKPGAGTNAINLGSAGLIPVAMLSSPAFDAAQIDPATVALSGAQVKLIGKGDKYACGGEDVNGDGLTDLVCHIMTAQFLVEPGASVAVLEAETFGGVRVRGEDSIQIVKD